jgi:hypothetical protein
VTEEWAHLSKYTVVLRLSGYGVNDSRTRLHQEDLWRTWPFIYGFAFSAKKWGELNVDWMTPVKYEDTAFDQLVIPADKKELIQALVKYRNQGFSDIISNKGGGCIFLLHGSPGVGKTLTAESIAEFLHKPLYRYALPLS